MGLRIDALSVVQEEEDPKRQHHSATSQGKQGGPLNKLG
jgi:hypothetical protein